MPSVPRMGTGADASASVQRTRFGFSLANGAVALGSGAEATELPAGAEHTNPARAMAAKTALVNFVAGIARVGWSDSKAGWRRRARPSWC